MANIITISGKARHGKDTVADALKNNLESIGKKVLIVHYADYLKFICKEYFGWDGKKDEKGREILQKVGTEKIRARDGDFHVAVIERLIWVFQNDYDYIIIPDTRFPNEINYLTNRNYDVIAVHIERLNFESELTDEQKNHPSETALDNYSFDFHFKSESGLDNINKAMPSLIKYIIEQ